MKKLLVMMLVVAMSVAMLTGCNTNANGEETSQNLEVGTVSSSEEGISDGEVSEEMTLEERIAAEMPAKLEVPEGYVPETVTAEQIMTRWEEIKVSDVEYAEDINKENLAGMLVLNCSYMEPAEFKSLVDEYFDDNPNNRTDWSSVKELIRNYGNYKEYLVSDKKIYGADTSVIPEKLLFDEYLINQAEQLTYLIQMYQTDAEYSKEYYDIIFNYVYCGEDEYFTFEYENERTQESCLVCLQELALGSIFEGVVEYNTDLYLDDNIFLKASEKVDTIIEEKYNQ